MRFVLKAGVAVLICVLISRLNATAPAYSQYLQAQHTYQAARTQLDRTFEQEHGQETPRVILAQKHAMQRAEDLRQAARQLRDTAAFGLLSDKDQSTPGR